MAAPRRIIHWLSRNLPVWEQAGWVTKEGARAIRQRYGPLPEPGDTANRLFAAMATLGAALLGGGIILLFAYNWNEFGRPLRAFLSFLPLFLSQILTVFTLWEKPWSRSWSEGSATALVFSTAACIGLISQTYNIQGDLEGFLFMWLLLSYPVIFILRSPFITLLVLVQFTWWMILARFGSGHLYIAWLVFVFPAVAAVWVQWQARREISWLNIAVTAAATTALLTTSGYSFWNQWLLLLVPWLAILSVPKKQMSFLFSLKALAFLSRLALVGLLIAGTYSAFWDRSHPYPRIEEQPSDWIAVGLLYILASILAVSRWRLCTAGERLVLLAPFLTLACWTAAVQEQAVAVALALNGLVVLLAIWLILASLKDAGPGGLRSGVGLLAVLILLRFFDYEFSLMARGIAFIVLGVAFLVLNYWIYRKERRASPS